MEGGGVTLFHVPGNGRVSQVIASNQEEHPRSLETQDAGVPACIL